MNAQTVKGVELRIQVSLLQLTSPEHLLVEKMSYKHCQRVSPTSTTKLGLPYNEVQHLSDRRLTPSCLAPTQRQNIQENPPTSSPASYPLHHACQTKRSHV